MGQQFAVGPHYAPAFASPEFWLFTIWIVAWMKYVPAGTVRAATVTVAPLTSLTDPSATNTFGIDASWFASAISAP